MRQVKNILPLIFYFHNLHDKVQPQAKVENVKRSTRISGFWDNYGKLFFIIIDVYNVQKITMGSSFMKVY